MPTWAARRRRRGAPDPPRTTRVVIDGDGTVRMSPGTLPMIGGGPVRAKDWPVNFVQVAVSAAETRARFGQALDGAEAGRR